MPKFRISVFISIGYTISIEAYELEFGFSQDKGMIHIPKPLVSLCVASSSAYDVYLDLYPCVAYVFGL